MRTKLSRNYAIVTFGIALVIAYGSLYPFDFSLPVAGPGPVQRLLSTWANKPGREIFSRTYFFILRSAFLAR